MMAGRTEAALPKVVSDTTRSPPAGHLAHKGAPICALTASTSKPVVTIWHESALDRLRLPVEAVSVAASVEG